MLRCKSPQIGFYSRILQFSEKKNNKLPSKNLFYQRSLVLFLQQKKIYQHENRKADIYYRGRTDSTTTGYGGHHSGVL